MHKICQTSLSKALNFLDRPVGCPQRIQHHFMVSLMGLHQVPQKSCHSKNKISLTAPGGMSPRKSHRCTLLRGALTTCSLIFESKSTLSQLAVLQLPVATYNFNLCMCVLGPATIIPFHFIPFHFTFHRFGYVCPSLADDSIDCWLPRIIIWPLVCSCDTQ